MRMVYIVVLFSVGLFMIRDYYYYSKLNEEQKKEAERTTHKMARWVQRLNLPPFITFETSKVRVSLWVIIFLGVFTGYISGFLGVGGGFIRVPVMIYLLGLPTVIAVGTDLFAILISNSWGAYIYAVSGKVEIIGALVMLVGASVGIQIGAVATAYVKGMKIRLYFGVTLLLAGSAVVLKQLQMVTLAGYLMFSSAAILSCMIIFMLISAVNREVWQRNKLKGNELLNKP
nr:sulfite exporter TauE/SafE family protein [Desulforamulus aquiferis]